MAWHLGLYDLLTTCAGRTWAGGLVHNVVARHILQFFQDIGPQFFEAAAAVGASVIKGTHQTPLKLALQKGREDMRNYHAGNERLKRRYEQYLREAKGQDEKSIDKVRAALVKFEECTKYKPFKAFHIDHARQFKDALSRAKTTHGKLLSLTTTDATLRLVKGFFHGLAGQKGFKKVVTYADVEYFNNNHNDARAAHTQRPKRRTVRFRGWRHKPRCSAATKRYSPL